MRKGDRAKGDEEGREGESVIVSVHFKFIIILHRIMLGIGLL